MLSHYIIFLGQQPNLIYALMQNLTLTYADYAILIIVVLSTLVSLVRGFVKEALSLATWIIAFIIAFQFNERLAAVLERYINTPSIRLIVSFGILFVATLILGALVNFLLSRLIVSSGLGGTDKSLGMIFGLMRGVLLCAVILSLLSLTSFSQDQWWVNSIFIPHFKPLIVWLKGFLPEKIGELSGYIKNN